MILNDYEIVSLYHARNEQAIEITQRQYGKYCHAVSMNVLHSEPDAEECVNDTWLRAWNTMPPKWPQNLCAYLGKITRNLSINRLKSRRRQCRDTSWTVALEELEGTSSPLPTIPTQGLFAAGWTNIWPPCPALTVSFSWGDIGTTIPSRSWRGITV